MTSFCVKTNNRKIIDYLLNEFENINIDEVYISNRSFKIYENIIIHYKGNEVNYFLSTLSDILASCIINFFEEVLLKKIINVNYFYFNHFEKKQLLCNALEILKTDDNNDFEIRKQDLFISCLKYINENKTMILDGFVNFRINNYMKTLDGAVDLAVNKFLIDREYSEFIKLLKLYINSKPCQIEVIHLIYVNKDSILINDNKEIISIENNIFNAKYLSDITFSSNDYALNALLTLLPEKIVIHLIDEVSDEFINTLKLIFEDKVFVCMDCPICMTYRMSNRNSGLSKKNTAK